MVQILVINGPNLNKLGKRDPAKYGGSTLKEIETAIESSAKTLGVEVDFFQSNHEGAIVDFIHNKQFDGAIVNLGALTQVGYSVLDALLDTGRPIVEVHISNIHAREEFRRHSVIAPFSVGQIAGLGWNGYIYALDFLKKHLVDNEKDI